MDDKARPNTSPVEMLLSFSDSLTFVCKCFFNHSAAHRQVPGTFAPSTSVINSYFSVVDIKSGTRIEAMQNGSNCPSSVDPSQAVAYDTASATDYFCSCPNPNSVTGSGNLLEVPMIGIIVSFIGAVMQSLGQVLMKWAHTHNQLRPLKDRRPYYANPLWYIGLLTYAASQILCVVAFASVTQGENAVIGTFSLAANAIFAQRFLGEAMQPLHFVGILFIAAGSTLVLLSTLGVRCINTPEAVEEIKRALSPTYNLPFFCFMMILGTIVFVALTVRRVGECSKNKTTCFKVTSSNNGVGGASRSRLSDQLNRSLLASKQAKDRRRRGGEEGEEGEEEDPNERRLTELNSTHSSTSSLFGKRPMSETFEQYSDRAMLFVTIAACMGCISSFCASVTVKLVTVEISSFGTSVAPWVVFGIFIVAICMSMHYLNQGNILLFFKGRLQ